MPQSGMSAHTLSAFGLLKTTKIYTKYPEPTRAVASSRARRAGISWRTISI